MSDESTTRGMNRRDLLKLGAAAAGAAILPSVAASVIVSSHRLSSTMVTGSETQVTDHLPKKISLCRTKRPNVLLIVLDTVRADHLSCFGYERETTPRLDAFAATARNYTNVMSPASWTLPSHACLFTGLPVRKHGARYSHQFLDLQSETLAELLRGAGYQTAAWSCNGLYACPRCGLDRGFQEFTVCSGAADMHHSLGQWLDEQYRPQDPFFIFLNYIEAHFPYSVPAEYCGRYVNKDVRREWTRNVGTFYARLFEHMFAGVDVLSPDELSLLESLYDEGISYIDQKLGQLFAFLERNSLEENTLIVITSDHGEHFNERHLMWHGLSLYEPNLRVPLIVRYADLLRPDENRDLVQSHDVFPTILEICQVEWKKRRAHHCESLLHSQIRPRMQFAEFLAPLMEETLLKVAIKYPRVDLSRFLRRSYTVRSGNMKLLCSLAGTLELYDLKKDPLELQNLATERPQVVGELSSKFDEWASSFEPYEYSAKAQGNRGSKTTEEEFRAGRGLGYVH